MLQSQKRTSLPPSVRCNHKNASHFRHPLLLYRSTSGNFKAKKSVINTTYTLHNQVLQTTDSSKYQGVTLSDDLMAKTCGHNDQQSQANSRIYLPQPRELQ